MNMSDNFHQRWSHRWLSPKTEVRESPICATGVFAVESIKKGEVIRVTGGIVLPKSQASEYNKLLNYVVDNVYLDISDDFALAPTPEDLELTATINHSCEPNAGFLDTITIIAIRDIEEGEEIGWDYAFSQTTFDNFECRCLTPSCRKIIKATDWQIKSIQDKFGSYFSPYLKSKF
ncbi:MAG: SET domain-containing protein-lysine N-methyltransferase [Candidatus Saccharibacteria bacterium]|nr:SET domain-containing protein-lysine N-methyltransferase [Candidatus Saccharibacteria bacterium]